MRVKSVSVTGLFGLFNHSVTLNANDRVTIVHGPNGFGKTVILNMIAGLIEGNQEIFERIPFDEFRLELADGAAGIIRKQIDRDPQAKVPFRLEYLTRTSSGHTEAVSLKTPDDVPSSVLDQIDQWVPSPFHRVGRGWGDARGGKYSLAEILVRFPSAEKGLPPKYRPALLKSAAIKLRVLFVETNRLRTEIPPSVQSDFRHRAARDFQAELFADSAAIEHTWLKVESNSQDLVQRIKSALADYAKHSQDRDRTFPERLVRFVRDYPQPPLDERSLLERMNELETKRQRLVSLGVLDSESGLRDLSEEDVRRAREALTIYVGDVEEKLRVFDDLVRRIGTLRDILNDRLPYKRLVIDRERGMRVVSQAGQEVQLRDLSSGEQHQLVVLYELLFRAPKQGLVLVDEPEISLHVAWQSRFLPDLVDILNVTDSYAIVATHSPMIIGNRWDLTVELEGPLQIASAQ